MTYIVVDTAGIIINRVLVDPNSRWDNPYPDTTLIEDVENSYSTGGSFINGVYTPPFAEVFSVKPKITVTPRQARLALLQADLLDQVEIAVSQAGGETKITWDYATEINRDDPLIETIGQKLNMTEEQIDGLFTTASTL